uniref:Transporter n=1 Tax=Aplanochytrium stocchinoi TaxID=215587 RepID=A0A6S8CBL3_9STRA|eukprot:CAMPEP_0204874508 /NCGR_PEP_ID=MMETSP1348-20121228/43217_1 /ASSEMBLY_ACC=CAM_ASM_000700 /TAXON_ID=215587 /ORGANISM="Aplanochytrium stocchinoi, Strain GSBS06" /LENGTH=647 /DNA_ID=CAMNT_0052030325 /DNA_START=69 /DNA_END=2012 /DNA_ORIENTATION=-
MAEAEGRDRWSSRTTFILGAVGSAVGLGNLWRFPFLTYKFGGGTFLVPYICAFFVFGVPLLFLELTLGRTFQGGDPVCFSAMHPRLVGIGWMSAYGSFLVATYYVVLIGWVVIYFFESFQDPLPWDVPDNVTGTAGLDGAVGHFFGDILMISDGAEIQEQTNPLIVVATIFVWICTFLSIFKGVGVVSQIVKVSVPVPLITLAVLLFNSVGKDGASDGIEAYIGNWDFAALQEPIIWQSAVGQIFFSIGVCFGVMTAYSSYMESKKGLLLDSVLIASINSGISLFAGFVVFTAIGVLANDLGVTLADIENRIAGPGLVFVGYPAALAKLDTAPQAFSALFFVTIFFLALDSAFSLVESVVAAIYDTDFGRKASRPKVVFGVCLMCFIFGIWYCLDNGLYMLDVVDYYLNNFIMLGVGALECIAATWVYGYTDSVDQIGAKAVNILNAFSFMGGFLCVIFLIALPSNNLVIGFITWPLFQVIGILLAYTNASGDDEKLYNVVFSGGAGKFVRIMSINEYDSLENVSGFYRIFVHCWAFLIKYLIPVLLSILMGTGAKANFEEPYEGYPGTIQNIGAVEVVIAWLIFAGFLVVGVDVYSEKNADFRQGAKPISYHSEVAAAVEKAISVEDEKPASTVSVGALPADQFDL